MFALHFSPHRQKNQEQFTKKMLYIKQREALKEKNKD
jgi:hypothetical protein